MPSQLIVSPWQAGRRAVAAARQGLAEQILALLQRQDPEAVQRLTEVGVLRKEWVEHPGEGGPISTASPLEVLERTLSGVVERRPSLLASLGLSALEVLSLAVDDADDGAPTHRLTVAFTDIEGFTHYTARHGDAAAADLLAQHYRTAGPIVRSRGGRVVKRLGDGLLLTFGEPVPAVRAACELAEHPPAPLRVRVGLHVGDVLSRGNDVVGHVVNVAARITGSARGGEVLISTELRDALAGSPDVQVGRARRRRLRGVPERIAVCPVSLD